MQCVTGDGGLYAGHAFSSRVERAQCAGSRWNGGWSMYPCSCRSQNDVLIAPGLIVSRGCERCLGCPSPKKKMILSGRFVIHRKEVRPFTDKQIELVTTFAYQAVIAIENVLLFQELEARTRELVQSVGELRALGEVGQAVSSTLDLEIVLDPHCLVTRSSPERCRRWSDL